MLGIISKKISLGLQGTTFERVVCKCKTLKPKPWINVGVLPFRLSVFSSCVCSSCVFWPVFSACQLSLWIFEKSFPKRWESLTLTDCGKGSKDTFTIFKPFPNYQHDSHRRGHIKKLRNIHPWGSMYLQPFPCHKYLYTKVTNLTIHSNGNHGVLLKL